MDQFCNPDKINNEACSQIPEDIDPEDSEDIFHFLHRYFTKALGWRLVLELNQKKVRALVSQLPPDCVKICHNLCFGYRRQKL